MHARRTPPGPAPSVPIWRALALYSGGRLSEEPAPWQGYEPARGHANPGDVATWAARSPVTVRCRPGPDPSITARGAATHRGQRAHQVQAATRAVRASRSPGAPPGRGRTAAAVQRLRPPGPEHRRSPGSCHARPGRRHRGPGPGQPGVGRCCRNQAQQRITPGEGTATRRPGSRRMAPDHKHNRSRCCSTSLAACAAGCHFHCGSAELALRHERPARPPRRVVARYR